MTDRQARLSSAKRRFAAILLGAVTTIGALALGLILGLSSRSSVCTDGSDTPPCYDKTGTWISASGAARTTVTVTATPSPTYSTQPSPADQFAGSPPAGWSCQPGDRPNTWTNCTSPSITFTKPAPSTSSGEYPKYVKRSEVDYRYTHFMQGDRFVMLAPGVYAEAPPDGQLGTLDDYTSFFGSCTAIKRYSQLHPGGNTCW